MSSILKQLKISATHAISTGVRLLMVEAKDALSLVTELEKKSDELSRLQDQASAWSDVWRAINSHRPKVYKELGNTKEMAVCAINEVFAENKSLYAAHEELAAHLDDANRKADAFSETLSRQATVLDDIRRVLELPEGADIEKIAPHLKRQISAILGAAVCVCEVSEARNAIVAKRLALAQRQLERYRKCNRWNIDELPNGDLMICRGDHLGGDKCTPRRYSLTAEQQQRDETAEPAADVRAADVRRESTDNGSTQAQPPDSERSVLEKILALLEINSELLRKGGSAPA
jgi:hypothetical protein